jgi:hypothetical protein
VLFRRGRINGGFDFRNPVRRKSALMRILADRLFVRRDVHTIDLVLGDIAVQPLNFRAKVVRTEQDFWEMAWNSLDFRLPAPGVSRLITYLGRGASVSARSK